MPVNDAPRYEPPFPWVTGHLQTIAPGLLRRVRSVDYERERIDTPDGDFLDLDWSRPAARQCERVAIIAHGLEGHSRRPYVRGMARAFNKAGWDAMAWNFRGCSGEPNKQLRFYHSGSSDDLRCVIDHTTSSRRYGSVVLIGFSLGGNVVLKYLGEQAGDAPAAIKCAVTFSVPCNLRASSMRMASPSNFIYLRRFLKSMRQKVRDKDCVMPGQLNLEGIDRLKDFAQFDDRYTAPLNGFRDAEEYWQRCSSRQFIGRIEVPTLLVSARNDPFLTEECFPVEEARASERMFLEMPPHGGHVGFPSRGSTYWSEERAIRFAEEWK